MRCAPVFFAILSLAAAAPAPALPIQTADELCDPGTNPCVVSRPLEVSSDHPLDLGLRVVRIEGEGHLSGTLDLSCGGFETDVAGRRWMDATPSIDGDYIRPLVKVVARRSCSGNSETSCMTDADCEDLELGSCTAGDGGIRLAGDFNGIRPHVELTASSDVQLNGRLRAAGLRPVADGGTVRIESTAGSIDVSGVINVNAGFEAEYYVRGEAGYIALVADGNIHIANRIRGVGGDGSINLYAGGDIDLNASILGQGASESFNRGCEIEMKAGGDIRIAAVPDHRPPLINVRGGTSTLDGGVSGEGGGPATLTADGDIVIAGGVVINADSGRSLGDTDDFALGGYWSVHAGDDLVFGAVMSARGRGKYGYGAHIELTAVDSVSMEPTSSLILGAQEDIELTIESKTRGPIALDGFVSVAASIVEEEGSVYGYGGALEVTGGDVTVNGTIENGGDDRGGIMSFEVCRLHLTPTARIDGSLGMQDGDLGGRFFDISESMVADAGSVIAGKPESRFEIFYRDAAKPPVLNGIADPAPLLFLSPALYGCPVCGNGEIDQGETCDDGNTAAGDGCDPSCLLEP